MSEATINTRMFYVGNACGSVGWRLNLVRVSRPRYIYPAYNAVVHSVVDLRVDSGFVLLDPLSFVHFPDISGSLFNIPDATDTRDAFA